MAEATEQLVLTRRLFSIEEYDRLGELGVLHEDERVELIEGDLIQMAAIGSRHMGCVNRVDRWFNVRLADRAVVSVQNPVRLPPRSEPQPDIALLRPRADFYSSGLPGPADVLLVIEVSDTTLVYDRDVKLGLYAGAGIPEVWIVDLDGRRIFVYRQPDGAAHSDVSVVEQGLLSPTAFPDLRIRLEEIIG